MKDIPYPIRINRYLLLQDYCSRRQADRFIQDGKVYINDISATLGQLVQKSDVVRVADSVIQLRDTYVYYLYNKPRGIVSHNPQRDEQGIADVSGLGNTVSPVGRLDKDSRGLLLLTNDGRIVNSILDPQYAHEREYEVTVDKYLKESVLNKCAKGVDIEGYVTKPAQTCRLSDTTFTLVLTEGKKHQIRRMCAALGYQVIDLRRTRIMHLPLDIPEGDHRPLTKKERTILLNNSGIASVEKI